MTDIVTLLQAVSANVTGPAINTGRVEDEITLQVSTSGTVSAFSVQLAGSLDGVAFQNIGSAVTGTTAGTNVSTGVLYQYFRATLSGYSGTGTVTCTVAYNLAAALLPSVIPAADLPTLDQIPAPVASVSLNSQKITSLLFGASTNDAAAWGQLAGPAASDVGLLAWTGDTYWSGGNVSSALTTAGTVYLSSFINRKVQTFTNLLMYVGTAGNTLTSGQCFAGIYDSTGTLRATTTDQAANWGGTGLKTAAFTVAYASAPIGTYYAGVFFNGTTGPVFKGSSAPASLYNAGLSGANLRCATTSSTSNTTSMPSPLTLSASSSSNSLPFWCAIT